VDSQIGLRRVPPPDLDTVASDPVLVERIAAEIERDGPMTFARFMALALYEPDHGYYRAAGARPGRRGDFLTAPEAHPIFGRAIARHVVDAWRAMGSPPEFVIREHGAGSGALAVALLDGLAIEDPTLYGTVRYQPVEVEARRLEELRGRLTAAGHEDRLEPDDGSPVTGIVLANEVLDALPTRLVEGVGLVEAGGPAVTLREVFVGWRDGAFVDVTGDPSTPALVERLDAEGIRLQPGQRAEVCLAVDDWVAAAADGLGRGVALFIDYGYPAVELYDPIRRPRGTLAAYLGQRAHDDPYRAVGRQDLTAHVDTTAVEHAAVGAGLAHLATTTQARFLAGLGAGELLVGLQTGPEATLQRYLDARAALVRMIDPAAMGRFRVMVFGRGLDAVDRPRLRGLD
jgi:SAM-dependent MidA family methyltransferase